MTYFRNLTVLVQVMAIDATGPIDKQDNYSTVRGDSGCSVGEVRVGTTIP